MNGTKTKSRKYREIDVNNRKLNTPLSTPWLGECLWDKQVRQTVSLPCSETISIYCCPNAPIRALSSAGRPPEGHCRVWRHGRRRKSNRTMANGGPAIQRRVFLTRPILLESFRFAGPSISMGNVPACADGAWRRCSTKGYGKCVELT